jgi:histone H3/H4
MARTKRSAEDIKNQLKAAKRKENELKKKSSSKKVTVIVKPVKPVKGNSLLALAKAKVSSKSILVPKTKQIKLKELALKKGVKVVAGMPIAKRHEKELTRKTPMQRITWPVISRIGKVGGIKRLSHFGDNIREQWMKYLRSLVGDSTIICDFMRRKTVSFDHVKLSAERHGERLFCKNGI